jgi:hypothetical protein
LEREVVIHPDANSRKPSAQPEPSESAGDHSEQGDGPSSEIGDSRSLAQSMDTDVSSRGDNKKFDGEEEEIDDDDDDDDDDEEVGEIPYVDMPGISLEEELEEDCLAAAK